MNYTALGNRIKKLRQQKRLTQEQLAEQAGISATFMGHIERGTRIASLETLVAICNALEASPEYLLCDSLVPTACTSPANVTGQKVAQLRKHLQDALDIVDQLGNAPTNTSPVASLPDISLESLDVTYRAYVALKRAGLNTVADLLSLMRTDLPAFLSLRGIGQRTTEEVLFKLRDMGIDVDDLINRLGMM